MSFQYTIVSDDEVEEENLSEEEDSGRDSSSKLTTFNFEFDDIDEAISVLSFWCDAHMIRLI